MVRSWCITGIALVLVTADAGAQGLRFGNHREVKPPGYATLRIGPFYSTIELSQSAGYRYTQSSGSGTDFLYANSRGVTIEDGGEFPLTTRIDMRNYLMITRSMDFDMSLALSYEHFPLETQEDEFNVHMVDEGIYGNLTMGILLSPFLKGRLYDNMVYRTDYIDTRGLSDPYGGQVYEHFRNTLGMDLDWLFAVNQNLGLSLSRFDLIPDEEEYEDQERFAYRESLVYEYSLYSGLVLGCRADYTQTYYDEESREDTRQEDYSAFVRFGEDADIPLTRASVLTLEVGYSRGRTWEADLTNETDQATASGKVKLKTRLSRDLAHELSYGRMLRGGFVSAFEQVDEYRYEIGWKRGRTSANLYSTINEVTPSSTGVNAYRDWKSGVDATYPLAYYVDLVFASEYSVRENEDTSSGDAEWQNDYDTWSSRLGTSFALTRKVNFTTYVQHVERWSGSEDLEYERDTFSAVLTFKHRF